MYKIYCDDQILYNPLLADYLLIDAKLELELNKAGTLTITIPADNPSYELPQLRKSIIKLYDDNELIFRGVPYKPSRDIFADNKILCAGELVFFSDTIQLPLEDYFGSVEGLFTQVVDYHNSQVETWKQFYVGDVTVTNDTTSGNIVRSSDESMSTWEFLEEKFLKPLGGYLRLRHETDGVYIDYLDDLVATTNQNVRQCINLIDVKEDVDSAPIATIIVPYGAKLIDMDGNELSQRLTIESVNGGIGNISLENDEAIAEYGRIVKTTVHDDIHEAQNLKRVGERDLMLATAAMSLNITAADLSKAGENFESYRIGTYITLNIPKLGINRNMLIKRLSLDLLHPESSNLCIGDSVRDFTTYFTSFKKPKDGKAGTKGKDAAVLKIDSSRGTLFKTDSIVTDLTVTIYLGGTQIATIDALREKFGATAHLEWEWLKLDDEAYGIISATDPMISNDGFTLTLTPEVVDTKVTFRCNLIT